MSIEDFRPGFRLSPAVIFNEVCKLLIMELHLKIADIRSSRGAGRYEKGCFSEAVRVFNTMNASFAQTTKKDAKMPDFS